MKKFYKYSLIIAGILAGVGLVLCLSFGFIGGRAWKNLIRAQKVVEQMAKLSDYLGFSISFGDGEGIYIGSTEDTIGVHLGDEAGGTPGDSNETLMINGERILVGMMQYEVPADEIRGIVADLGAGSFEIKENESLTDTVRICINGIGNWNYTVEDGKLQLGVSQDAGTLLGNLAQIAGCVMELPKDFVLEELVMDVGAGEVWLQDLCAKQIWLEVGAGQIEADHLKSECLNIDVGAGQTICTNMESVEAGLTVSMGECSYQGSVEGDLTVECATGNVELSVNGKETDRNYDISCSMGNIEAGSIDLAGINRKMSIDNEAEHTFIISCNMGNVTVDFRN